MPCPSIVRYSAALALLASAGSAHAALSFTAAATSAAPHRPSVSTIADLDGDGDRDVAVTTDTPDKISILLNNGSGVLAAPFTIPTGAGTGPEDIIAADVDGDGDQDLVVVLQNINTIRVFVNNGGLSFIPGSNAPVGANARGMSSADIDGDGDPDFGLANRDDNTLSIIRNNAGTLASSTLPAGIEPRAVAFGNFDGDGDQDLVVTNHDSSTITVMFNGGAANFAGPQSYPVTASLRPEGVATGDMDRDGDIDIVITAADDDAGLNFVSVFRNGGAGTFTGPLHNPTQGAGPDTLVITDLDADGDNDVAVVNQDSNNVSLMENNGTGALTTQFALIAVDTRPRHIAAGRLDGNTSIDLVVTNRDSSTISVLLNQAVPACRADFNRDGSGTVQDLFDFLGVYFAGLPAADFNASGGAPTLQDLFDFVTAFFAGCP